MIGNNYRISCFISLATSSEKCMGDKVLFHFQYSSSNNTVQVSIIFLHFSSYLKRSEPMCSSSTHQIEYLRVTWVSSASLSDGSGKAFRLEVRTVRNVFSPTHQSLRHYRPGLFGKSCKVSRIIITVYY